MSNPTAPSPAYKPNDPPQLHSTSMEALCEYFMRLDFYNRRIARVPISRRAKIGEVSRTWGLETRTRDE
ncbi:BQ2448_2355 [Microbotryum intermedium]|uniref:BQ2448_2355 protein n=1 Tax=Microbotryum intermedium TaxID=269621 RepID=A0A238F812_9BASI|nr:BQ2448_2355 [Microbotryum intermedium]